MATGFIGNVGAFFVGEALQRADQIFALVADKQPGFSVCILKHGIHVIDAVDDRMLLGRIYVPSAAPNNGVIGLTNRGTGLAGSATWIGVDHPMLFWVSSD